MIKSTKSPSSIRAGETLPALVKRFTTVDLMAYAAATWDWHRVHYDVDFARKVELPNVIIDGQVYGALFARSAVDWAGPRAFVTRLAFKMKSMAFAGATLRVDGQVTEICGDIVSLAQRLTSGSQLVAEATLELRLPLTPSSKDKTP